MASHMTRWHQNCIQVNILCSQARKLVQITNLPWLLVDCELHPVASWILTPHVYFLHLKWLFLAPPPSPSFGLLGSAVMYCLGCSVVCRQLLFKPYSNCCLVLVVLPSEQTSLLDVELCSRKLSPSTLFSFQLVSDFDVVNSISIYLLT